MLPKKKRLTTKAFRGVFKESHIISSPFLTLRYTNPKEGTFRFSVVVSKKIAPTAVLRNRLRRRGYRAVQKIEKQLNKNVLGIFFLKKEAINLSQDDMMREMAVLLKKAGSIS